MATDIVLKDRNGQPVTYEGIETVTFNATEDGTEKATFTLGVEQTGKEVELNFEDAESQTVTADDGCLLKELTIIKPDTLVPENIRYGENVGGVDGTFKGIDDRVDYTLNDNGEIVGATFYGNATVACPSCTTLKWVDLTNSIATSIGNYAFYQCTALTSINIPDSVTSIGTYAFYQCTALTSINIPDSVTSIGANAFDGCTALTSIDIPDSVTSIGNYAFRSTALTSIIIPDSVTSIGASAFYGCSALASVTIGNSVTSIGASAFYSCTALTSVTIPGSVTSFGTSAFYGCAALTSVSIESGVTSLGVQMFMGCTQLASIALPDTLQTIGMSALNGLAITSIIIPASVTRIGKYAFKNSASLASVTFEDTAAWYYTSTNGATSGGTLVSSSNLANTSTAATYLITTYINYEWYKT